MVPFIDVMLVLLIIFMVTAPLITPSVIDLPSVGKATKQPDQVIEVVIGKDEAARRQDRRQDRAHVTGWRRRRRDSRPRPASRRAPAPW